MILHQIVINLRGKGWWLGAAFIKESVEEEFKGFVSRDSFPCDSEKEGQGNFRALKIVIILYIYIKYQIHNRNINYQNIIN
jgi:hypothetical protein